MMHRSPSKRQVKTSFKFQELDQMNFWKPGGNTSSNVTKQNDKVIVDLSKRQVKKSLKGNGRDLF